MLAALTAHVVATSLKSTFSKLATLVARGGESSVIECMNMKVIQTEQAPQAIGPYSQAIQSGQTVYLSGQIPLDPVTMQIVSEDINIQAEQVLKNMQAVVVAAGGSLQKIVKLTIFLTDLNDFAVINEAMKQSFVEPYPARSTVQVVALPRGAKVEIEGIMVL